LTVVVFAECRYADERPRDLWHLDDAIFLKPSRPQPPRLPIAEEVRPDQLRKLPASIDVPTRYARGQRMWQRHQRRRDRHRARFLRLDRLRPFHSGPTIIAAALHAVDHLPQLPADVTNEKLAGR